MRQKGRRVPPLQPGQRKQYAPGQLIQSLEPVLRQNIERIARVGYETKGRGLLVVELNDEAKHGIANAQYLSIAELGEMNRGIPFAEAQPTSEAVKKYDPEREFVAMIMDTSPWLPGPQMWFDVFPRELPPTSV